jgi:glucosamine--fructose-6-phosphate aminotransferase (isomerizing)
MNNYIKDILAQPETLQKAVHHYPHQQVSNLAERLKNKEFDRVILSGMGASLDAAMPAASELSKLSIPVIVINSAELLNYHLTQITDKTFLWLHSQSGRSVELVNIVEAIRETPPAVMVASVNDPDSPLAKAADLQLLIQAGEEATVSVKTYTNMLAVNLLAAIQLAGGEVQASQEELLLAAEKMAIFLADWDIHLTRLDTLLGDFETLFLLGRGGSLCSVNYGALITKEAAKAAFHGYHAAEFRHGPLELVQPGFCAILFAGDGLAKKHNFVLAQDIQRHGGKVIWVAQESESDLPTFQIPYLSDWVMPFFEMLPMQALSVIMAKRNGFEPGVFRYVGKVTTVE